MPFPILLFQFLELRYFRRQGQYEVDYKEVAHMNWGISESIYSLLLQHESEAQNSIPVHFRAYSSKNEKVIL
jgi:hypothetical protein